MNKGAYYLHLEQWKKRAKKPSTGFLEWQKVFLEPLEKSSAHQANKKDVLLLAVTSSGGFVPTGRIRIICRWGLIRDLAVLALSSLVLPPIFCPLNHR